LTNIFNRESAQLISRVLGQRLSYVAGPELWHHLSSDLVYLVAEDKVLGFQGDIQSQNFEGFEADYSEIQVNEHGESELMEAEEKGNLYYFHSGEKIEQISIIRDTIILSAGERDSWQYTTDVGVLFKLTSGALTISKLGYHDELLQVKYYNDFQIGDLPTTVGHFENSLYETYRVERSVLDIAELS
jgi:hypothetical protein